MPELLARRLELSSPSVRFTRLKPSYRRRAHVTLLDTIGGITSPWIAGPLTDKFGRRAGMFIGAIIICIGVYYGPFHLKL